MKRAGAFRLLILAIVYSKGLTLLVGCAAAAPPGPAASPSRSGAPYESRGPNPHSIQIEINARAAREILATLSRDKYDATDAKLLVDLPAVRLAIQDSGRDAEAFERDLAQAFDEKARAAVFDFRSVRENRARWEGLLQAIASREAELSRMAAERAAVLLPADRPVSADLRVFLSFGLAGLADHVLLTAPDGRDFMIVDLARALGDVESEPIESQVARLARLIAGGAFRQAWAAYRQTSPAWQGRADELGPLGPLLRAVAEAGPPAIFTVDESFFPLTVWLKEPMKRSLSELNRLAERVAASEKELEQRVELTAEIRRPEFARRLAGPAGAFLADAIIQAEGLEAYRTALAGGPRAFFQAYDRVARERRDLISLADVIRDRLAEKPAGR
jgi:hypothetical protein